MVLSEVIQNLKAINDNRRQYTIEQLREALLQAIKDLEKITDNLIV
jgi:hypothetical protein